MCALIDSAPVFSVLPDLLRSIQDVMHSTCSTAVPDARQRLLQIVVHLQARPETFAATEGHRQTHGRLHHDARLPTRSADAARRHAGGTCQRVWLMLSDSGTPQSGTSPGGIFGRSVMANSLVEYLRPGADENHHASGWTVHWRDCSIRCRRPDRSPSRPALGSTQIDPLQLSE